VTRRSSYSEGVAFGTLSFGVIGVVGLVTSVVTARIYGVEVLGEFALVYAPTGLTWYVSTVKEQAALVRELSTLAPRTPRVTALFAAVFTFSSGLTLLVSVLAVPVIVYAFQGPLDRPDLIAPACVTLASYALLTNTGWNVDTVLSAFMASRALFWIRLHQAVSLLVFSVLFGLRQDAWALVLAMTLASATSLVHRIVSVRSYVQVPIDAGELRDGFTALPDLLRFGIKVAPGTIAQGVSNEVGTWVLAMVSSVAVVGAYNRAWSLGRRFLEVNYRITEMLLPTLVRHRAEGHQDRFEEALAQTLRYASIGLLLPAAAAGGAAHAVMQVFGPGFERASGALAVLLVIPTLLTLATVQAHALYSVDRPLITTVISFARLGVTVAATVVLTDALGTTGTALALAAGYATDLAWKLVVVRKHLRRSWLELWPMHQILAVVLAYVGGFAAARAIDRALEFPLDLVAALPAGGAAYAAVLVACGGVTRADWARIRNIVRLMFKRVGRSAAPPAPVAASEAPVRDDVA
jgi:O-antigen/teichoic acid export membrane protein